MNNPLITGKEVLDRLYSHLRDEVKFSQTTLLKHKRNWDSVCSFAQEQGLSLVFSDIDNLQRFAYRMTLDVPLPISLYLWIPVTRAGLCQSCSGWIPSRSRSMTSSTPLGEKPGASLTKTGKEADPF